MQTIGIYTVESTLGAGGHGEVYRSTDPLSGRPVAIKVMHHALARDAAPSERFFHEARLTLNLDHPGIIRVYDVGHSGGRLYTVMELFEHGSLADALAQRRIHLPVALDIAAAIADALAYAHGKGIIHSDVKPSNVLLRADGRPVLVDFGLAGEYGTSSRAAVNGEAMGTPEYMAPEQIEGRDAGVRGDVYAFGVMLYELIAGRLPFEGTLHDIVFGHLQLVPRPLRDIDASVPAALSDLVAGLLAKDPQRRPSSISDVAAALCSIHGAQPAIGATVRVGQSSAYQMPAAGLHVSRGTQPATGTTMRVQALVQLLSAPSISAATHGVAVGGMSGAQPRWYNRHSCLAGLFFAFLLVLSLVAGVMQTISRIRGSTGSEIIPTPAPIPIEFLNAPLLTDPQTFVEGQEQWTLGSIAVYQEQSTLPSTSVYPRIQKITAHGIVRLDGPTPRSNVRIRMILRALVGNEMLSEEVHTSFHCFETGDLGAFSIFIYSHDGNLPAEGTYTVEWQVRSNDAMSLPTHSHSKLPVTNIQIVRRDAYSFDWQVTLGGAAEPINAWAAAAIWFDSDGKVLATFTTNSQYGYQLAAGEPLEFGDDYDLAKQPASMVVLASSD